MLISTRGEYGLRAMMMLAAEYSGGPLPLRVIAEKEHLSAQYLEHLFRDLRNNGLVESFRGAKGGYKLAKSPEEITVGNVLWALEGTLAPMECVAGEKEVQCRHTDGCPTKFVWEKLKAAMDEVLDTTTLADILTQATEE
mgnify:CR=1 FL=1